MVSTSFFPFSLILVCLIIICYAIVVESLIRNKLWPGYTLCPECYQSPVLPLDRNIKDLIIPKKGQTIRKYSVMEEEKVLESLIQPVLANAFNSSQVLYFLHSKAFSV